MTLRRIFDRTTALAMMALESIDRLGDFNRNLSGEGALGQPDLFRPEVLEEARTQFGEPVRPAGLASWLLVGFLTVLMLVVAGFLFSARYARKETVQGILQPSAGAVRVAATNPGTIVAVLVQEGDEVEAGQPLFRLAMDPTMGDGRRLGAALLETSSEQVRALQAQALAQREYVRQQQEEVRAKRQALLEQARRLEADLVLQKDRLKLAEQSAEAARTLFDQQLLPAIQYRQRQDALIVARQSVSAMERDIALIPSSLAQLDAQEGRLKAQADEAAAGALVARAQLQERQLSATAGASVTLTAQRSGQVAAMLAKEGSPAPPGGTLAILLPKGVKLQAELWVPSRAVGFVRPGDKVRLMYDAFPYQRFGISHGTVSMVARAPTNPADLPVPIETKEGLFRVLVDLDGQVVAGYGRRWPLAPGMRLTADLVLEDETFVAWLFDKVRAVAVRSAG